MPKKSKNSGFTLVELLVVITIIAILATIGLTIYTSAQKQAKDAKRRGDIDAIAKALETKKGTNSQYPQLSSTDFTNGIPLDATTAQYCLKSDSDTPPAQSDITAWASTSECPSAGSDWKKITSTGASGSTLPKENWTVCARLEESTSATLKVYCRSSSR